MFATHTWMNAGLFLRSRAGLAAAAALLLAGCNASSSSNTGGGVLPTGASPPNIIFILVDTLRADRLGCYGHKGGLTPNMDALAAEGVRFENCEAQAPWTLASVASIFSACYPGVHKATDYITTEQMRRGETPKVSQFSDDFDTLAETLKALNYDTAAFSANPFVAKAFGYAQGFDHFEDEFAASGAKGSELNRRALDWLGKRDSKAPLFLYLHYMDVHGPYDAPGEYADKLLEEFDKNPHKTPLTDAEYGAINSYLKDTIPGSHPEQYRDKRHFKEYWIAAYEAGVREMDAYLGELRAGLQKAGLWDSAYIILTADHGEAFNEHGYWEHGYGLYESELHVPLIMRWPGVLPKGKAIPDVVQLVDLMPTMLEQFHRPLGQAVQGRSFLDLLRGEGRKEPEVAFAEANKHPQRHQWAVRRQKYKLIRDLDINADDPGDVNEHYELYDEATDPDEQRNLVGGTAVLAENQKLGDELTKRVYAQIDVNKTRKSGLVVKMVELSPGEVSKLGPYVGKGGPETRPAESQPASSQPAGGAARHP